VDTAREARGRRSGTNPTVDARHSTTDVCHVMSELSPCRQRPWECSVQDDQPLAVPLNMLRLAKHALKRTRLSSSHLSPLHPSLVSLASARRYNSSLPPSGKNDSTISRAGASTATRPSPDRSVEQQKKQDQEVLVKKVAEELAEESEEEPAELSEEEQATEVDLSNLSPEELEALQDAAFPEMIQAEENNLQYPDLMDRDPILDSFQTTPLSEGHSYTVRAYPEPEELELDAAEEDSGVAESSKLTDIPNTISPFSDKERKGFHEYQLLFRFTTKQTGKGKVNKWATLTVVGDGNGLIGMGQGKDDDAQEAHRKARNAAFRSMDYIDRFEDRTFWTEMRSKLGGTEIILRPRPVGFGLRCNPHIHQILKAAGFKDASAKVWGSRKPINVMKLLFRMIMPGNAPQGMGNGIGGPGSKMMKGSGMRSAEHVERERGRKLVPLRG
jgi:small subunit ribosomal protein S5